jgi:hypothetical protein
MPTTVARLEAILVLAPGRARRNLAWPVFGMTLSAVREPRAWSKIALLLLVAVRTYG